VTNEDHHGSFSGVEAGELDFGAILVEDLELASLLERFGGKDISHDDDGPCGEVESGSSLVRIRYVYLGRVVDHAEI
jgi:hypothetical protein